MARKSILCVDFDGVIHAYTSPWINEHTISDGPVPGALRWLYKATEWFDVQIYSSRSKSIEGRAAMLAWMIKHSFDEFGEGHPMGTWDTKRYPNCEYPISFAAEKPAAFLTIDDRALTFDGTWPEMETLKAFKPWNKR